MKKGIKKVYIIEIFIFLITAFLFFVKKTDNKNLLAIIFLGIILFVVSIIYKKKRDTNIFRKQAFTMTFSIILFYFIVLFMLGLLLGYNRTLFSLNPMTWMHGLIPAILITFIVERIRFIIVKNNEENRTSIYIITVLTILFYIVISTNSYLLNDWYNVFLFLCITIFPNIARELLSTHVVRNYGFLPTIFYKLVMRLYVYILPIFTDLGDYLYSAMAIILPFTIYAVLNRYIKTDEEVRQKNKKFRRVNLNFITIPTIALLVVIICLVSGLFKHKMVAIASNSMVPVYERGDAIIFEKYVDQDIKEGEIIVFKKGNILVAHRVIKTKDTSDKLYFYTKGDANDTPDEAIISQDEVQGIVKRVIKYIGYPTVWINELFGGEIDS